MYELALFAGAGGGILGGHLLGWTPVCAVEIEKYPRECLLQRQRDGILPPFPIWDDVTTFDGKPWRGLVDVVSGGFPCQDISCAGKGEGISGSRSGLWKEMCRIICEVRPLYAFMENSPLLTSRGIHVVLGDLAEAGYDAAWLVLAASDVGAPHQRKRIWILAVDSHSNMSRSGWGSLLPSSAESHKFLANTMRRGQQESIHERGLSPETYCLGASTGLTRSSVCEGDVPDTSQSRCQGTDTLPIQSETPVYGTWASSGTRQTRHPWQTEPNVGRVADGVASRVDRLKAIGNGQVPLVAAQAFTILQNILNNV